MADKLVETQNGKSLTVSQLELFDVKRLTFPAASSDKPKTITRKAQATIETTLAIMCTLLLLLGAMKIFIWLADRITRVHIDYEQTRADAGAIMAGAGGVYLNVSNYPKLDIFGESQ